MKDKIESVLNKVRPYIQMHRGDVQLLSIKEGVVRLKIYGACIHCSLADLTYNKMVRELLREEIPEVKEVTFDMQD